MLAMKDTVFSLTLSFVMLFSSAFTNPNSLKKIICLNFSAWNVLCSLHFSSSCFSKNVFSDRRWVFLEWVYLYQVCTATASFIKPHSLCGHFTAILQCWLDWLFVFWLAQDHLVSFVPFVQVLTHTHIYLFMSHLFTLSTEEYIINFQKVEV